MKISNGMKRIRCLKFSHLFQMHTFALKAFDGIEPKEQKIGDKNDLVSQWNK